MMNNLKTPTIDWSQAPDWATQWIVIGTADARWACDPEFLDVTTVEDFMAGRGRRVAMGRGPMSVAAPLFDWQWDTHVRFVGRRSVPESVRFTYDKARPPAAE